MLIEKGVKHRYSRSQARLTDKECRVIRARKLAGETYEQIHKDYPFVKLSTIVNLFHRRPGK